MWEGWPPLYANALLADIPEDSSPTLISGIHMLYAADLQWDRFLEACDDRVQPLPYSRRWAIEVHFFLVAADNAYDRLRAWSRAIGDNVVAAIVARLEVEHLKDFRHHQEHLEERMAGGKWERRSLVHDEETVARLRYLQPGEATEEAAAGVPAYNLLFSRRWLMFGDEHVDLEAVEHAVIDVGANLIGWLGPRRRPEPPRPPLPV